MNQARRKALADIITKLDALRDDIQTLNADLEAIKDEEQEYFDNMPESFQYGDKGQAAEQAVSSLDDAFGAIEEASSQLEQAIDGINAASE